MNWHSQKPNEFQNKLSFPFCCETHIQLGINIGLNSKQCCQSLLTLTFKLGKVALPCKTVTPAGATDFPSNIILSFIRFIISSQQVSVFLMKERL